MKKTDFVDLEELKKVNSKDNNILKSKVNEKEKGKVGNLLGGGEIRFFEDLNFKHGFFSSKDDETPIEKGDERFFGKLISLIF